MDKAVMRQIGLIGLLDPERNGLRDQFLEFDVRRHRNDVQGELEVSPDARVADHSLRHEYIAAEQCIQFQQPVALCKTTCDGRDNVLRPP